MAVGKIYPEEMESILAKLPPTDQIFIRGDQWPSRRRPTIIARLSDQHPYDIRQYVVLFDGDTEEEARQAMYRCIGERGLRIARFDDWWAMVDSKARDLQPDGADKPQPEKNSTTC